MRARILAILLCATVPAAAQTVSTGSDLRLLESVRRIAERTERLREESPQSAPIAVRASREDRETAARDRMEAVVDADRLDARGRAWEDLGLGFSEAPAELLEILASDLDGVDLALAPLRILVDPERLTASDFRPDEAGEADTTLLLATGVRPDEPLVAHVLVHWLQVEREGGEFLRDTTDGLLASGALAEGEANLVALRYLFGSMGLDDTVIEAGLDPGATLRGALLPPRIATGRGTAEALARFAYREGFSRVADAYAGGGWQAVDDLRSRAASTRDLMHPDRPVGRTAPPGPPGVPLPDALILRDTDVLGEQAIVTLVSRTTGKDNLGLLAGDGWAGDALYRWEADGDPGAGVTAWVSRWSTPEEAADFAYGYARVLRARFGTLPDTSVEGVWVRSGTPERGVFLRRDGDEVAVWISPPGLAPAGLEPEGGQAGRPSSEVN